MFVHLLSIAARAVELRANSQVFLDSVSNIVKSLPEISTKIDSQVPESEFVIQTENLSFNAANQDGLKEILSITGALREMPEQMHEILGALAFLREDPVSDLKSGAYSFAILFTDSADSIKGLKGIEEVSHIKFFLCTQKALADGLGCPFPGVLAFNSVDKNIFKMPFHHNLQGLVSAITVPAFTKITQENFRHLQTLDQRLFYVIDEAHKFDENKAALNEHAKRCSAFSKFVYFTPEDVPSLIDLLNTSPSEYPLLVSLAREGKGIVRSVTPEGFASAVQALMTRQAEKLVFSSPLPEDNETRPVKVLNTETISKVFESGDRDVLVAFTSPRCGYCKALEPVLEQLSTILGDKSIPIFVGNYNIMENEEQSQFEVTGVPTLFFKKKGADVPVKVPAEIRSLKEFLAYISKEGGTAMIDLSEFSEYLNGEVHASEEDEAESQEHETETKKKERDVL